MTYCVAAPVRRRTCSCQLCAGFALCGFVRSCASSILGGSAGCTKSCCADTTPSPNEIRSQDCRCDVQHPRCNVQHPTGNIQRATAVLSATSKMCNLRRSNVAPARETALHCTACEAHDVNAVNCSAFRPTDSAELTAYCGYVTAFESTSANAYRSDRYGLWAVSDVPLRDVCYVGFRRIARRCFCTTK